MKHHRLSELTPGQGGCITAVGGREGMKRRLPELGFVCGSEVSCLFSGRAGGMSAYLIKGGVVALRREDAREIEVAPDE